MTVALGFAAFAVIMTVLFLVRTQRRQRDLQPLWTFANSQPLLYRVPVEVKVKSWMGWSTKTLIGLQIDVRSGAVALSMTSKRLGGPEWLLRTATATIEVSRQPGITNRQWIILTGQERGRSLSLAVSAGRLAELWSALLDAGVTPNSAPPEPAS
jgi:hypothetical protein